MLGARLKTSIVVSQTRSITKAAELLRLTQPAVSQQIKNIEDYYNVKFINKAGQLKCTLDKS